jgi:dolichol-phosphate mannosyltransferase
MAHLGVVIPIYQNEIVLVEDCGSDQSWKVIQGLSKADPRVKGYQLSRNFGQHYAITAGVDFCHADWVIVMDGDLQDPPEEIPRLYAKAQEGFDVVVALRKNRKFGLVKNLSSKFFYWVFSYLAELDYDTSAGNFRIMSQNVAINFRKMREELRFFPALMHWMGFRQGSIDIEHADRLVGKSSYTYLKLIRLAAHAIIAYSDKPLRLAIKLGFAVTGVSFMFGIYIVYRALFLGIPVTGWASLIVSIYLLGGIIIAILGIIGTYLGKTFEQTKQRPLYIIREITH